MWNSKVSSWGLRVLAALVVATAIAAPFYLGRRDLQPGNTSLVVPNTHDMAQHLAVMEQFDKVLRSGTFYPRWLPDVNDGYGLAWTNFYPPGLYYVTSLVNALVNDWMYTMFIVSTLGLAASGLSFYFLSRTFYGEPASLIAALLYMVVPYHTMDLYWRGAIPELMGFILVPPIIYFAFKLATCGNPRYFAGLGFFHGIYILTHFPVAYLMTYLLALYAVSLAVTERDWRVAIRIGFGIALALLVGSVYWVPAALEASQVSEQFSLVYAYYKSYVTLLPGGDAFGDVINVSFTVQVAILIVGISLLYFARRLGSRVSPDQERAPAPTRWTPTRQWVLLAIASIFMCTSLSIYISRLIPRIDAVSFPWRWLVIATCFVSLVVAAAADRLSIPGSLSPRMSWVYRIALTGAMALSVWFTVRSVILPTNNRVPLIRPQNLLESGFIPAGATAPQHMAPGPVATIQPSTGQVQVVRWEPMRRQIRVDSGLASVLRLKTYNFSGWTGRVDGQPVQISSDTSGAQIINLSPGEHTVEVFFVSTPPRSLGGALTGAGLLLICGLVGADLVRRRRTSAKEATDQNSNLLGAFEATRGAPTDEETSCAFER